MCRLHLCTHSVKVGLHIVVYTLNIVVYPIERTDSENSVDIRSAQPITVVLLNHMTNHCGFINHMINSVKTACGFG